VSLAPALAEDVRAAYEQARQRMIVLARRDFTAFVAYVMRHFQTGKPVSVQPFQSEWGRLAQTYDRLLILAFMESGKSFWLSVALTLWELGRNPWWQFLIVSRTDRLAQRLGRTVARYILESRELREVFPHLRPDATMPWNANEISVVRPGISRDPSVQFIGVGGSFQGSRLDVVMLDDVLDWSNTRTAGERNKMWDWHQTSIPGRLTAHGRERAVGNAFHRQDLYHRLALNERWQAYRFPVLRADGRSAWPGQWPLERIELKRMELGPIRFKIQMLCEPVDLTAIGQLFRRGEVEIVDAVPPDVPFWVRRWDLACTEPHDGNPDPDWLVGVKMGQTSEKKYFVAHVERQRTRNPFKAIHDTAELDGNAVLIGLPQDPGQAGKDQVRGYTTDLPGYVVWVERETGDKVTRASSWSTQWQAGNVQLLRAPWNEPFLTVLEAFPTPGIHDDDVDASGGAFRKLVGQVAQYQSQPGLWRPRR
jgi:predicted phage terminase large subunit-like protein